MFLETRKYLKKVLMNFFFQVLIYRQKILNSLRYNLFFNTFFSAEQPKVFPYPIFVGFSSTSDQVCSTSRDTKQQKKI